MKPNKIILVNIPKFYFPHCEVHRYHLTPKTFAQSGDGGETREGEGEGDGGGGGEDDGDEEEGKVRILKLINALALYIFGKRRQNCPYSSFSSAPPPPHTVFQFWFGSSGAAALIVDEVLKNEKIFLYDCTYIHPSVHPSGWL